MEKITYEQLWQALEDTRLPPREYFDSLVQEGLINARGELTKLFGGEAEPEPGVTRKNGEPARKVKRKRSRTSN